MSDSFDEQQIEIAKLKEDLEKSRLELHSAGIILMEKEKEIARQREELVLLRERLATHKERLLKSDAQSGAYHSVIEILAEKLRG